MKRFIYTLTTLCFAGVLMACPSQEGPMEKAGKKVDEAAESVKDAVKADGPMEKAGEAVDETIEDVKDAVEN